MSLLINKQNAASPLRANNRTLQHKVKSDGRANLTKSSRGSSSLNALDRCIIRSNYARDNDLRAIIFSHCSALAPMKVSFPYEKTANEITCRYIK